MRVPPNHRISTLGAVVLAVAGMASCGGSDPGEIVARVGGVGSISKATLDHWLPVEAVILHEEYPTKPAPKGVLPDPPDYAACIAYLKATHQKLQEKGPEPTAAGYKSRCEQKLQELKEITLNLLIYWDWIIAAGTALGIRVSETEVTQRFAEVNKNAFPRGKTEFANYLKITGQTVADMMFRSKVLSFEAKFVERQRAIERNLPAGPPRRSALAKLAQYLPPGKQWAATTNCHTGYVVSSCRQYTGTQAPGSPN
jgi:hypothetical protein